MAVVKVIEGATESDPSLILEEMEVNVFVFL
jgi:hypothetical protein